MKEIGLTFNLKRLLLVFLFFILQSCGYNLRENPSFFLEKNIAVISNSNALNQLFVEELKKTSNSVLVYESKDIDDLDLIIRINNHQIKRFSSAQGSGARTVEVRIDYNLVFSIEDPNVSRREDYEIKDVKYVAFNDSQILAMEAEENDINKDFIKFALKKIELLSVSQKK
jgi:outer membrane lipopolysaccharide assembly protein LptE/RlpB